MTSLTRWLALTVVSLSFLTQGCNEQSLARQVPKLIITPMPTAAQEVLEDPTVGIQLGEIPLFGIGVATFELKNEAYGTLQINSATVKSATGGTFTISTPPPEKLMGEETGEIVIQFVPEQDELEGVGIIELKTNAGAAQNDVYEIEVRGTGLFIGDPKLVVNYGGLDYPLETQCSADDAGMTTCSLTPLDFGNIPIGESATQPVKIKNVPATGTCKLPDLPNGEPDCTPACVITIDANPDVHNLGIGLTPADTGFSIVGGTSVPFKLAPANEACPAQDDTLNLLRGELTLLVDFAGADEESDHATTMVVESDAPNAQQIAIPISAKVRKAPIAVAKLRECTSEVIASGSGCSDAESLEPLMRVYFDGTDSYDPNGGTVASYSWEVIDQPPGTDTTMFQMEGENAEYFSFWMPLAGNYTVKLTVINDLGVPSAETESSIVVITAIPDSRLHIQLTWDSPTADLDLHFVYADPAAGYEAYHEKWDCYWQSCKAFCDEYADESARCDNPTLWFENQANPDGGTYAAFEGPNPRLDIDDTNGFGPENVNIDLPATGKYHIYTHYYGIGDGDELDNTRATIRVYGDGVLMGTWERVLEKNHLWAIASVDWNTEGESTAAPAQADGEGVYGSVVVLPYLPPNGEGFYFGNVFD